MAKQKEVIVQYCKQIKAGKLLAGRYVKKAVERFLSELEQGKQDDFPYFMDWTAADEVIGFAESLKIPDIQTETKHLELLPWMKFVYANIWGWKQKENPEKRRFRTAYVEVARKNSKTTSILFPFILYDFLTTDASEAYFVSKDNFQSEKTYKELQQIIKMNDELAAACSMTVNAITYLSSRITFFCEDSKGIDSYKNSFTVIDEFHAYESDKVVTAFRYGGRARLNNTVVIITSAGTSTEVPCYQENEKCKKVLDGFVHDDTYFGIIYAYDARDKWDDPKSFIKANPSLGSFLKNEVLLQDLKDAEITLSHQADFKAKTCGIWTNSVSQWLPLEKLEITKPKRYEDISSFRMAASFDLAQVNDLTVFTIASDAEDFIQFDHWIYLPEATLNKYKTENVQVLKWLEQGYITPIRGETIDYDFLFEQWSALIEKYKLGILAYDRWHSNDLIKKLEESFSNVAFIPFEQSMKSFSNPTKYYEKLFPEERIIYTNPVAHSCLSNVAIKPDPNNNYKPMKKYSSSFGKIDTVITSIMALDLLKNNVANQRPDFSFNDIISLI